VISVVEIGYVRRSDLGVIAGDRLAERQAGLIGGVGLASDERFVYLIPPLALDPLGLLSVGRAACLAPGDAPVGELSMNQFLVPFLRMTDTAVPTVSHTVARETVAGGERQSRISAGLLP
jgi:hypothetical protein